jgi:LacI family transcriptional regulator
MIQGPPGAGGKRNDGYVRALQTAGIPLDQTIISSGEWTRAGGAAAARALLELRDPPTAIFCANDLIALGAMDSVRAFGMSVPHGLALVGFDDIEAAAMVSPALSTVSNPAYEIGLLAGHLLRERMSGQYRDVPRTVTLPCRLITRGTA